MTGINGSVHQFWGLDDPSVHTRSTPLIHYGTHQATAALKTFHPLRAQNYLQDFADLIYANQLNDKEYKKATLSQGNRAMQHVLPTPIDSSIVIYIHCIKADLNAKL